jgi:hypothetical protein
VSIRALRGGGDMCTSWWRLWSRAATSRHYHTTGNNVKNMKIKLALSCTYDHRILKIRLPVRSAIYKQDTGGLVVRWVTTSESPLLYVLNFVFARPTSIL